MINFINKKTGEIKSAFSAIEQGDKVIIRFTDGGKEYAYHKDNIEIVSNIDNSLECDKVDRRFRVYTFKKECYRCHRETDIITYIKFADNGYEDLVYPWDKHRLMKNQTLQHLLAHIKDPSIEYYSLMIIGDCQEYDDVLMKKFPNKITVQYSATTKTSYPMNLCSNCGAQQGHYFVYRQINEIINSMEPIDIVE